MPDKKLPLNLQNKLFRSLNNTVNGEVGVETRFHYRQKGDIIWATYEGGQIRFGTLSGFMNEKGELQFRYQHQNQEGVFMTGKCRSVPEWSADNKLRFREFWQWTSGDDSKGESLIEEVSV